MKRRTCVPGERTRVFVPSAVPALKPVPVKTLWAGQRTRATPLNPPSSENTVGWAAHVLRLSARPPVKTLWVGQRTRATPLNPASSENTLGWAAHTRYPSQPAPQ